MVSSRRRCELAGRRGVRPVWQSVRVCRRLTLLQGDEAEDADGVEDEDGQ